MVIELMQGSLNSSMGEHLMANNKLAYSGHQTLPITPDGIPSGAPAVREALSDPELRDLRVRGSIFYRCHPCVWRSQTRAKKTQGFNDFNDFNVLNESAAGGR